MSNHNQHGERFVIVNADDFGLSWGTNRGVITAHERGIVSSASLMVRPPAARDAAAYALSHPRLGIGLHLDFGEWAFQNGEWALVDEVVATDDAEAIEREAERQLEFFRRLVRREPTHLDSHQHLHRSDPIRPVVLAMARRLGVPLRHFHPDVSYCGSFYGQTGTGTSLPELLTPQALVAVLGGLPPGISELACHPGSDPALRSPYRDERLQEVETLCDPSVREALQSEGINLISFRDVPGQDAAGAS